MRFEEAIRLFGLNNLLIDSEIRQIETENNVNLSRRYELEQNPDQIYYPQFSERHRAEAHRMSANYEIFYCLENSIREIIVQRLEEEFPDDWWNSAVPDAVRTNAERNQRKEIASGVTLRSNNLIDFTSFGELGEIIKSNWDTFSDLFRDQQAVVNVLAILNTLRAPIAHCKVLAEDEELRLRLGLRDWFRQME